MDNYKELIKKYLLIERIKVQYYTPKGIRIPVCSVKGSCPRPLDDGGCISKV